MATKLSLAYQIADNVLGYVNYGKGYRSGGFNSARRKV
jgi:outer membrane receptor protein involved in Fe transport